jgi:hypothetical protein
MAKLISLAILAGFQASTLRTLLGEYQGENYTERNQEDAVKAQAKAEIAALDAEIEALEEAKKMVRAQKREALASIVKSPASVMVARIHDVLAAQEQEARENAA